MKVKITSSFTLYTRDTIEEEKGRKEREMYGREKGYISSERCPS